MSSFTSKTVCDLYEAYDAVYINEEEIFLNQLLGEVAETINGLVDEGWDFSEYSWEEIYESFIDNVLVAEIDEINSFFVSLNEEVLSEEEINNFMQENLLMRGLARFLPGAKGVQQAATATKPLRPSIIQAAPVKPGVPAAPISQPRPQLSALGPGVRPVKPSKPLPPPGSGPGSFERFGNWLSSLTAKGRAKPPASTPPSTPPPSTPPRTPRTPSGQQGWPSIGVRKKAAEVAKGISDTYSKVKTALTPGPKVKAVLKYGVAPPATIGALTALGVSGYNLATGRASGLQQLSGVAQGATGHIMQGTAGVLGKLGSPDAPGTYEWGKAFRQAGADTQAKVEAKRKSQQGTGRTGTTGQVDPTTGKPVYNSYEMKGEESLQEVLAYDKKNDRWYNIDPSGKKTEVTPTQTAIDRYNRLRSQAPAPASQPPRRQPAPASQPPRNTRIPLDPGRFKREQDRLKGVGNPPTPPAAPPTSGGRNTPSAAPSAPARRPAPTPQASQVAKYMAAAASARKIQDPGQRAAEMEKVKQSGLEIWKAKYKDTLAKPKTPEQKFNPLMDKTFGYQTGNAPDQIAKASADASPTPSGSALGAAAKPEVRKALNLPPKETPKQKITSSYEYDPFDLVLEYLLSEGHVDSLDEALYVMMEMNSKNIQNIVEAQRVLAQKTINGVTVPGYVNVERQGGFLGFGGRNVPVKGSFRPSNVSSGSAARYNQQIDTKYGTGSNKNAMPALRVQQRALNQGSSGYMRVANPQSIPNTGAADRPTPQRAGDQNRALDLLRPDVPIKSTVSPTPENSRDPEFRRSGDWVGDPNAGRTSPKPASKSKNTMTDAEFDKKYAWAMNPPKSKPAATAVPKVTAPKPAPAAVALAPKPPTIQSQNVTTGGVKYERRTPTSAEMAAAKKAGGGEAGVKAAVDIAKSNQIAATSPTPDLKPEAPKKRESLMTQIDDLRKMRTDAEERNK